MAELPAAQVRSEIEQLLDTAIERATSALEESGTFFPFALAIEIDREADGDDLAVLEAESEDDDEDAEIDEEQALDAIVEALGENQEAFRAAAIAFDAEVDEEWDGITVLIAHREGLPIDAVLPYRIAGSKRVFAELEREPGTLELWGDPTE
jgi:hypothetical protein